MQDHKSETVIMCIVYKWLPNPIPNIRECGRRFISEKSITWYMKKHAFCRKSQVQTVSLQ